MSVSPTRDGLHSLPHADSCDVEVPSKGSEGSVVEAKVLNVWV